MHEIPYKQPYRGSASRRAMCTRPYIGLNHGQLLQQPAHVGGKQRSSKRTAMLIDCSTSCFDVYRRSDFTSSASKSR